MDPEANLREQLLIASHLADHDYPTHELADRATRLAELVLAMDEWISHGGFLPAQWRTKPAPRADAIDRIREH